MIEKKLKELYQVDTISQDKGWKKIREKIDEIHEPFLIDFTGINIIDPWSSIEFKQIIKETQVHMRFTNNEELANRIKIMCIMDGSDPERVESVTVEKPREKTNEEKRIEKNGSNLLQYFDIADGKAVFTVSKKYSQIQNNLTIDYINYAISELNRTQEIKDFLIDLNNVNIIDSVTEAVANMMVQHSLNGVEVKVDITNEDAKKNIELHLHKVTNQTYDKAARFKAIKNSLTPDTCGILIKYKKSRALDEFGRHGKGEVVSSRIAIFRGFKQNGLDTPLMIVETYNNNYFYTKQHWAIDHDNELLDKLHVETVEIKMDEIGFADMFLGTQYHFMLPIQQTKEESEMVIEDIDENGRNIRKKCTIPERMKIVFNDWGVKYNKEALEKSIIDTREHLDSLE